MRAQKHSAQREARHLPVLTASDLGRPHSRVRNPIMAGYLEGITQAIYDCYAIALNTATVKVTLFSVPQGSSYALGGVTSFVKTQAHTSMLQAGVLEAPKKHIVRAISVLPQGNTVPADIQSFLMTHLSFLVNQKSYQEAAIARLPGGGGPFCAGLAGTFTAPQGWQGGTSNGWPDTRNTYSLAYGGVPIEQQQNFAVIIDPTISGVSAAAFTTAAVTVSATNPVAGVGIFSLVYLDGTLFRAVQ